MLRQQNAHIHKDPKRPQPIDLAISPKPCMKQINRTGPSYPPQDSQACNLPRKAQPILCCLTHMLNVCYSSARKYFKDTEILHTISSHWS